MDEKDKREGREDNNDTSVDDTSVESTPRRSRDNSSGNELPDMPLPIKFNPSENTNKDSAQKIVVVDEDSKETTKADKISADSDDTTSSSEVDQDSGDNDAEKETTVEPLIETEIEPETIAAAAVEQEPSTVSDRVHTLPTPDAPQSAEPGTEDVAPLAPAIPISDPTAAKTLNTKRLIIMAASGVLLIIVALITWWLLSSGDTDPTIGNQTDTTVTTPAELPKLGIAATLTEGTVEFTRSTDEWQPVTDTTQLQEGDSIRTGRDGRAVLTLDDGSAIRLDANTIIKLTSLTANQVQVEQLDGIAYSRIIPSSERTYTVMIDGTTYQALGTAFATIKSDTENGVRVFQSSVKVSTSEETITEGKQFYQTNSTPTLERTIADIDIDTLITDIFVQWNISLDEKDEQFKNKLGILAKVKQRTEEQEKAQAEAEAARQKAEEEAAAEEAAQRELEAEMDSNQQELDVSMTFRRSKKAANAMTLSVKKQLLEWDYLGKATNGYKLVYSKHNSSPVFGSDYSRHLRHNNQTSARLSTDKMDGKYYVRVCAYTKKNTCVHYSNVVVIHV